MTREQAIRDIENLFPTDSDFADTNAVGQELLQMAMERAQFNWRELPDRVLHEYRLLCIWKENDQIRKADLKRHAY